MLCRGSHGWATDEVLGIVKFEGPLPPASPNCAASALPLWNNDGMPSEAGNCESEGPICPNCRERLRESLRHERIEARGEGEHGPSSLIDFLYCGACGWPLHTERVAPRIIMGGGRGGMEVDPPEDETTLEGQFQLRSRDLIEEIRTLGFDPFVWFGLINDLGGVVAAKTILSQYGVLPVTQWLVGQNRPELTLEREIEQIRWADLFDDAERSVAALRIASITRRHPDQ
jgi:hypothetical protein